VLVETYSDLRGRRRRMNDNRFATSFFSSLLNFNLLKLHDLKNDIIENCVMSGTERYDQQHVTLYTCSSKLALIPLK
jgi:hypothetical protein